MNVIPYRNLSPELISSLETEYLTINKNFVLNLSCKDASIQSSYKSNDARVTIYRKGTVLVQGKAISDVCTFIDRLLNKQRQCGRDQDYYFEREDLCLTPKDIELESIAIEREKKEDEEYRRNELEYIRENLD